MMGISESVIVIKKRIFDKPIQVSRKKAFTFYKLYKSDYIILTKVWSPLAYGATALLVFAVAKVYEVVAYCISMRKIYIEPKDMNFLLLTGISSFALYILSLFVCNPKRKLLKEIGKNFKDID